EILFDGNDIEAVMQAILHAPVPLPSATLAGRWVPPELDELLLSMLEKNPADRPQTMAEVRRGLDRVRPAMEAAWARAFLPGGYDAPVTAERPPMQGMPNLARGEETSRRPLPLVLVVDDDKVIRGLLRSLVQSTGCDCETVDSG